MRTALDSTVILDVLTDEGDCGSRSESALRKASREGALIVGEQVLAEVIPALPGGGAEVVNRWLQDWQIEVVPAGREVAVEAGTRLGESLAGGREGSLVLSDLLIGAHALHRADRLLARPARRWKELISELEVIEP